MALVRVRVSSEKQPLASLLKTSLLATNHLVIQTTYLDVDDDGQSVARLDVLRAVGVPG